MVDVRLQNALLNQIQTNPSVVIWAIILSEEILFGLVQGLDCSPPIFSKVKTPIVHHTLGILYNI